jgi:MinD superfamily P-loop ATPase
MKIAIASGKGGTGKTTLSTNLASYLSQREDVVLVDLDVEEPNSALFLTTVESSKIFKYKQTPTWDSDKCNHCGKCQDYCNFNAIISLGNEIIVFPELCHSCHVCTDLCEQNALPMQNQKIGVLTHSNSENLSFIESRLDVGQEQSVPLIAQTIDYVNEHFSDDCIKIFDSPPGASCPVVEVVKDVDLVILVCEPTPFGFNDFKIAVETMRFLSKDFVVVINRFGIGDDSLMNYCRSENIKIIAKFPNEKKIAELYSQGKLIYPHVDEFKEQIEHVSKFILDKKGDCL